MVFQGVQTVKDPVMEIFLSKLIPQVLNWVQLRRVWREGQKPHVARNRQFLIPVPPRSVHDHHQPVLWIARRHLIQKDLHAGSIDMRQDQAVHFAGRDRHCRVRIGVFLGDLRGHHRAMGARTPAAACSGNSSKPGFVLKQETKWALSLPFPVDFLKGSLQFFFQSSWTSGSDFRCRLSGESFLHP